MPGLKLVNRYRETSSVSTQLDKFADVIGWVEGLRSKSYLADVIKARHALAPNDSPSSLASKSVPLIEVALNYIEQAERGAPSVAFLPLYYAVLNLAKVYVLLGPLKAELERQRRHGGRYDPAWNDQVPLERQKVQLQPEGVLGLFYRTVTGEAWPTSRKFVSMSTMYPFIEHVGAEYESVTGKLSRLLPVRIMPQPNRNMWRLQSEAPSALAGWEITQYMAMRRGHWERDQLGAAAIHTALNKDAAIDLADCCLRRSLLHQGTFHHGTGREEGMVTNMIPMGRSLLFMFEELPIMIALYYQASIARYKPEFLRRQIDSKMWPLLVALRRHGTFTFLLSFWNFIMQETVYITGR